MKIKIYCDNGANIHSNRETTVDTEDVGFTDEEWTALSEDEKHKEVYDWVMEAGWLDIGFEEAQ